MRSGRVDSLDLFRGLAAIAVVFYHFEVYLGIRWFEFSFVAVDLFFVLSGIVLSMKYVPAIRGGMTLLKFMGLRLVRLYPMAFIAGLFVVVLNIFAVPSGAYVTARDEASWRLFLLFPVMDASYAGSAFPPDGPAWSLWAELAINVVWFPLIKIGRYSMHVVCALAFAGMLYIAWRLQTLDYGFEPGLVGRLEAMVRAMAWFGVGCAISLSPWHLKLSPLPMVVVFLGVIAACVLTGHGGWRASVAIIGAGVLLLYAMYHAPSFSPVMMRFSRYLGMGSFPLYMIHAPAGRLLPQTDNYTARWLAVFLIIGSIAIAATLLNELVVERLRRLLASGFRRHGDHATM
jgi:peptidoglycan/LPS O-acetylase OafA/YrhL